MSKVARLLRRSQGPRRGEEEKGAGENLAGVAEENFQEGTFSAGEGAFLGAIGEAAAFGIKRDVAQFQEIQVTPFSRATQNAADAGQKLFESEGLHHVVIGTIVQAGDLVLQFAKSSEKNDRGGDVCLSGFL